MLQGAEKATSLHPNACDPVCLGSAKKGFAASWCGAVRRHPPDPIRSKPFRHGRRCLPVGVRSWDRDRGFAGHHDGGLRVRTCTQAPRARYSGSGGSFVDLGGSPLLGALNPVLLLKGAHIGPQSQGMAPRIANGRMPSCRRTLRQVSSRSLREEHSPHASVPTSACRDLLVTCCSLSARSKLGCSHLDRAPPLLWPAQP
jgi:hypothetical protein